MEGAAESKAVELMVECVLQIESVCRGIERITLYKLATRCVLISINEILNAGDYETGFWNEVQKSLIEFDFDSFPEVQNP